MNKEDREFFAEELTNVFRFANTIFSDKTGELPQEFMKLGIALSKIEKYDDNCYQMCKEFLHKFHEVEIDYIKDVDTDE